MTERKVTLLTGLSWSKVLSVLLIQTNNSLRACWNCPKCNRACSNCFWRSTIPRNRLSHLLLTAPKGSLMEAACSGDVLSVKSAACLWKQSNIRFRNNKSVREITKAKNQSCEKQNNGDLNSCHALQMSHVNTKTHCRIWNFILPFQRSV